MTLIPDVPLVIVVVHVVALASLFTHALITNWQRKMLLRQNRTELEDLFSPDVQQ